MSSKFKNVVIATAMVTSAAVSMNGCSLNKAFKKKDPIKDECMKSCLQYTRAKPNTDLELTPDDCNIQCNQEESESKRK